MSSRDLPLVSGIINIPNKALIKQMVANVDKTISIPKFNTIDGYILMTRNITKYPHVCTAPFKVPIKQIVQLIRINLISIRNNNTCMYALLK